jgi:tyrosine-specific transport protein
LDTKLLGGILLIIGTSIGGAMLALPVTAAPAGFFYSTLLLFACWLIMTFSAFLILEVNLWLPSNSNIVSMAKVTLGAFGQVVAWSSYLLLLYSLIAAYVASGTDVLHNLLSLVGINTADWLASILFVSLFSLIVFKGIQSVDYVNRALMATKLGAYVILVVLIAPDLKLTYLNHGELHYLPPAIMVMITSYGFATIVPSLRAYFNGDIKKLKLAILIGSLIPLFAYILWICTILGALPSEGTYGLNAMRASTHTTTSLTQALSITLGNHWITWFSRLFSSVAVITSFLGVSLGLSDFLADGFGVSKQGKGAILVYSATFIPSLIAVLFYPNAFIIGLRYAGTFCVILLAALPMLMAWYGRYYKNLSTHAHYQTPGGKPALIMGIFVSLGLTLYGVLTEF